MNIIVIHETSMLRIKICRRLFVGTHFAKNAIDRPSLPKLCHPDTRFKIKIMFSMFCLQHIVFTRKLAYVCKIASNLSIKALSTLKQGALRGGHGLLPYSSLSIAKFSTLPCSSSADRPNCGLYAYGPYSLVLNIWSPLALCVLQKIKQMVY